MTTQTDYPLTPHFMLSEFRCPCCGDVIQTAAAALAARLEPVRLEYGVMRIISSFRCPRHNLEVGGETFSQHLIGLAADIECTSDADRFSLLGHLLGAGFRRIGIAASYIHADIGTPTGPVIWTYYPKT